MFRVMAPHIKRDCWDNNVILVQTAHAVSMPNYNTRPF